jgi:hypothetical protein
MAALNLRDRIAEGGSRPSVASVRLLVGGGGLDDANPLLPVFTLGSRIGRALIGDLHVRADRTGSEGKRRADRPSNPQDQMNWRTLDIGLTRRTRTQNPGRDHGHYGHARCIADYA